MDFVSRTLARKEGRIGRDKRVGWDQKVKTLSLDLISMCWELIKGTVSLKDLCLAKIITLAV